jgi:hypothetical protein
MNNNKFPPPDASENRAISDREKFLRQYPEQAGRLKALEQSARLFHGKVVAQLDEEEKRRANRHAKRAP